MSLLGGALAGAVSGGANAAYDMADKTIDNNRRTAADELEFKRTTALEQMRIQSSMARDDINYSRQTEQRQQDREWAVEDRDLAAKQAANLASMKYNGSGGSGGSGGVSEDMLKGWEAERDYLRELAQTNGLSTDQEDLLWTLESNINGYYNIPTTQTLAPSIMREIETEAIDMFGDLEKPAAQEYIQAQIKMRNSGDDDFDEDPNAPPKDEDDTETDNKTSELNLDDLLAGSAGNAVQRDKVKGLLQGVDLDDPIARTDALLELQDTKPGLLSISNDLLNRADRSIRERQASIPEDERQIAEIQSRYLNGQLQLTREEAIALYPKVTSPVVREKIKRDFNL